MFPPMAHISVLPCSHSRIATQFSAVVGPRLKNRANNLNVFVLAGWFRENVLHELASPKRLRSGNILKVELRNVVGILVVVLTCEPHVFIVGRLCIKGERVVVTAGHLKCSVCG